MPLYFVENQGQMDERVAYYIQGSDKTIYFTPEGVTFALTAPGTVTDTARAELPAAKPTPRDDRRGIDGSESITLRRWTVKLDFVGANLNVRPVAEQQAEAVFSYFTGQPDQWHAGLRSYRKLVYPELWPGIDLVYYGTVNQMKYEFIVKPGADPDQIRLAYRGATEVRLNAAGQMDVRTPIGGFQDDTPAAYQEVDGHRVSVPMAYALGSHGLSEVLDRQMSNGNSQTFGFVVGEFDATRPLVLDPAVLVYAGYIGGPYPDIGWDIAVDGAGSAYVTGTTQSNQATFPVLGGPDVSYNGNYDAFVAKVNAAGTALVYAGYIGGASVEDGYGIAVDGAGNAYVTGTTQSDQTTFPVVRGPDVTFNGITDAFVAKVNAAGTALLFAGYIGGASYDNGYDVAVDQAENAYIVGVTESNQTTFPVLGGLDATHNGDRDTFVTKVNAAGTALLYAGYIGGTADDDGKGIAVDGAGNVYVTGGTDSSQTTFPVLGGPDETYNGGIFDAFIAKVNATGTALLYAGYIGGSSTDVGHDIAVDTAGNVYISGFTNSSQTTFPVLGGPDVTYNGSTDAFVAKVNATGTALLYAGYIGGADFDASHSIALDGAGNVYLAGATFSNQTTFPVRDGPDLILEGNTDAFVTKVDAAGASLLYATYIGGAGEENGTGVTVDAAGNVYVVGHTSSNQATFLVLRGPDMTHNGDYDVYVTKLSDGPSTYSVSGHITHNNQPLVGVTVSAGAGGSATTDGNGSYTLSGLAAGSYTLTPSLSSYVFTPATTTVVLPPSQTAANFVATPSIPHADKPVVVLVHGWLGFPGPLSDTCEAVPTQYLGMAGDPDPGFFEQIPAAVRDAGYAVFFAHIASSMWSTPSIGDNARCLANQLDWLRDNRSATSFILVAHSMGGLVSRGYIEDGTLDIQKDVRALITLGTPHEGTPIHRWLPIVLGPVQGSGSLAIYCAFQVAVCEFSVPGAAAFNSLHPPATNMTHYHFVAGAALESERNAIGVATGWALGAGFQDDGIVPAASSRALSFSGNFDRFLTSENHNIFGLTTGSPNYFNDIDYPSAIDCILVVLSNPSTGNCHNEYTSSSSGEDLDLAQASELSGVSWPIDYRTLAAGETFTQSVTIDAGPALFASQWTMGTVAVTLQDPSGTLWGPSEAAANPGVITFTHDLTGSTYLLVHAAAGTWRMILANQSQPAAATQTMSIIIAESAINLTGDVDQTWYTPGQSALVTATLTGAPATAVVTATLNTSDGASLPVPLTSIGNGQYTGNVVVPSSPGYAELKVDANGTSAQGAGFERMSSTLLQVSTGKFLLTDAYLAELELRGPGSYFAAALRLGVGIHATGAGRLALAGDLVDVHGTVVAHALSTVEVVAGDRTVQLRFASEDIWRSGLNGPYMLTHVVLADESGATLLTDTGTEVYLTPAYTLGQFAQGEVYLPLVRK